MNAYPCRTREQKAARAEYAALIADPRRADALYDALPFTQGGKIISTDFARYLDPVYAQQPNPGQGRDLAPSWEHAWIYAQDRLAREISKRAGRKVVRFMSGGWGAGKTHALEHVDGGVTDVDLVWDGTLADHSWAKRQLGACLAERWMLQVFHVHRNVEIALYGAIERGVKEGRSVPLTQLPLVHRSVQQSLLRLWRNFAPDPRTDFLMVHNTGTATVPGRVLPVTIPSLAYYGALHYSLPYATYHSQAAEKIHS